VPLFPIAFLSNNFVDPHTMPAGLRAFADANPISHLVTAARPDGRDRDGGTGAMGARRGRPAHRGVRAADNRSLPAPQLTPRISARFLAGGSPRPGR